METDVDPDIIAELAFYPPEAGGRQSPIHLKLFGCIFVYEDENFDCFVLLAEGQQVSPGDKTVLPIKFLRPQLIKPRLRVGASFKLRELANIAEGAVLQIIQHPQTNT
jgi:hypothetical protein